MSTPFPITSELHSSSDHLERYGSFTVGLPHCAHMTTGLVVKWEGKGIFKTSRRTHCTWRKLVSMFHGYLDWDWRMIFHWREGLLIAMLAHHVCTMNSPLPMLVKVRKREKFEIRETTPLPIRSHFAFADHRLAYVPPLRSLSRTVPV